ncbi:MAG TPA: HAMP domain-containing protein [candidate division Zixibacteria bacterium]|nr:HAMP domain-containing protein [candidate division Zixibacteria bacterium]
MIKGNGIEIENVVTSPAMHSSLHGPSVGGRYVNSNGTEVIGYCTHIQDLDAIFVSEIQTSEVMKPLIAVMWRVTLIILIAIIIGFAIFYLLLKKSLKPIQTLTKAVEAAAAGDLSIRVRTEGKDQIAKLASNFNYMIARLEESIRELRAVEEKERRLIEKANDAFLITDDLGNILRTNPKALELWGYTEHQVRNMTVFELFTEQSARDFSKYFRTLSKKQSSSIVELNALKSNNQSFSVEINSIALGDGTYLSIIRDMSEKRKLEQELIQAQKLESVGTLAAGVAHDFDNILVGVLGAASYLKSLEGLGETEIEMLNVIEDSAKRAAGLVKQLMAFARQDTPNRERMGVDELIEDVVRLLSRGLGEDIELIIRRSNELPEVYIDPIQIKQTLFNICLNARDAMPEGGNLTIEINPVELDQLFVQTHPNLKAGQYVQITVADNGVGMTEEQLARIFEPFYTTKPAGKGTGLGLAVSYGIIEAHGGIVTVDSQPGVGTAFHIFLPAQVGGVHDEEAEKPYVLVITKDNTTVKLLRLALGSKQYKSVFSSDIHEAQQKPEIKDRVELVFVGAETLDDDPVGTLREIKSLCDRAGIFILGEFPQRVSTTLVDGSVRDRYDVTSIIAIVRRYMGFGKSPR